MAIHVVNEAQRCLQCGKPMCREQGCPIHTNIPEMIRLFRTGKIEDAATMLFANNPLSVVCSLVCDHEKQCEGHCVLGRKGSAVQISSIENYISDAFLDRLELERDVLRGQRVAVVGAGPAGLTVAVILAQRGFDVTIFERKHYIGGMLRYGIPSFRLPKTVLDRYKQKLLQLGIHIRPNTTVGGALHLDDFLDDGYEAIFIGSGTWRARRLHVPGESLGNVHYTIDYLQNPDVYDLGERVAVIGAGNAAMDAARTALRKGSRFVTVYSREAVAAASQREVDYALADGISIEYGMEIQKLTPDGPLFIRRTFGADGNVAAESEPLLMPADSTIVAVSQEAKDKLVSTTVGLELNPRGLLEVDEDGRTTREGIFSAGDVVTGPRNVVLAVKAAKRVADAMTGYLERKARED